MRKVNLVLTAFVAPILLAAPGFSRLQQDFPREKPKEEGMKDCPMHTEHMAANTLVAPGDSHHSDSGTALESRGNAAMGFEQSKTTHHFLLRPDGGVIQVQANDAQDTASVDQIRKHFHHIAAAFAASDFQIPMLVHDAIPPGTTAMKRLHEKIQYTYEETASGARVVIKTADPSALDAIHDFLRYQTHEHKTGDPEAIS
jgi:hypothetical protein